MAEICIVILIGLPGAGKTTFCKQFLQNCECFNVIHVCYDRFIEFIDGTTIDYKKQRSEMIRRIKTLIISTKDEKKIPSEFKDFSKHSEELQKFVILIDDNNFYRGMRYEFLQLARKLQISFGQFFFNITLELAIKQNSLREKAVPHDVIEKMNHRIQMPSAKHHWELKTITLESGTDIDYEDIYEFLNDCFNKPECVPVFSSTSCNHSQTHKIDLILRKTINNFLKSSKTYEELPIIANELNEKRKSIINDLKLKRILLERSEDITEIVSLLGIE